MTRRVWISGFVLVVVGVLAMVLFVFPPLFPRTTPLDELTYYLLGLVPLLGVTLMTGGAVMLALAAAAGLTGRPLVVGHSTPLLLAGIGAVVLAAIISAVLGSLMMSGAPAVVGMVLSHTGGVLQMVGSALLACWLTGRLIDPSSSPVAPPLAPAARP